MGLAQEFAGTLKSQAHVITPRCHIEVAQEKPLHLPHRQPNGLGQAHRRFRLFKIIGHKFDDLAQLLRLACKVTFRADTLAIRLRADALMVKLFATSLARAGLKSCLMISSIKSIDVVPPAQV